MKTSAIVAAVIATAGLGVAGIGVVSQSADAAAQPHEQDRTYQMFANVDAEGDLGSNHDAVRVNLDAGEHVYTVTFSHPIGHCAAAVQPGRAGGSDPVRAASSVVIQAGKSGFATRFTDPDGNVINEPFMVTVTCNT